MEWSAEYYEGWTTTVDLRKYHYKDILAEAIEQWLKTLPR